jgi:hypothetical protein
MEVFWKERTARFFPTSELANVQVEKPLLSHVSFTKIFGAGALGRSRWKANNLCGYNSLQWKPWPIRTSSAIA